LGETTEKALYVSYALRWKTQYLGNYVLNGVLPPKNALI
jgi:hypothetical protein